MTHRERLARLIDAGCYWLVINAPSRRTFFWLVSNEFIGTRCWRHANNK